MTFQDDKKAILAILERSPYIRFIIDTDGEVLMNENGRLGRTYVYIDGAVRITGDIDKDIDRDKVYSKNNIEELFDLMFMERL